MQKSYFYCFSVAFFLMISGCPQKSICDYGTLEDQVKCLKNLPREEFKGFAEIKKQHKIYYSITTSPLRLPNLHYVLDTLDLSVPEKVFIVLPELYKNKEAYDVHDIQKIRKYSPKIEILRPVHDLGPIMKLVPAIETVRQRSVDGIGTTVLTFDDDTGYPAGLPEQLIKYSIEHGVVAGGSGQDAGFWDIKNFPNSNHSCRRAAVSECDVIEGFHAVAYPVSLVDTEWIKKIATLPECRLSDDIVISYVLAKHPIKRMMITNRYTDNLLQFHYGFGADALHNTNGSHAKKYQECIKTILEH